MFTYRLPDRIFFWNFFIYKNLHIEPLNYTIKSVSFDFCSTNIDISVIKICGSLLLVSMSLSFKCLPQFNHSLHFRAYIVVIRSFIQSVLECILSHFLFSFRVYQGWGVHTFFFCFYSVCFRVNIVVQAVLPLHTFLNNAVF